MARIYYVAEFVDKSISVFPATWVYKDSESCLFTFWSSSKSKVIGYEIANPRWMTYQINWIVAKLGKSKTMNKDVWANTNCSKTHETDGIETLRFHTEIKIVS